MDNIPSFWLGCAILGILVAIIATVFIVLTEFPPALRLMKKARIRFFVWKANHARLTDEERRGVMRFIEEGKISVVDIREKLPPPGKPWFRVS